MAGDIQRHGGHGAPVDPMDWLYADEGPRRSTEEVDRIIQLPNGGIAYGSGDRVYLPPDSGYHVPGEGTLPHSPAEGSKDAFLTISQSGGNVVGSFVVGAGSEVDIAAAVAAFSPNSRRPQPPRYSQLPRQQQVVRPYAHDVVPGEVLAQSRTGATDPEYLAFLQARAAQQMQLAGDRRAGNPDMKRRAIKLGTWVAGAAVYVTLLGAGYNYVKGDDPSEVSLLKPGSVFSTAWDQWKKIIPGI